MSMQQDADAIRNSVFREKASDKPPSREAVFSALEKLHSLKAANPDDFRVVAEGFHDVTFLASVLGCVSPPPGR